MSAETGMGHALKLAAAAAAGIGLLTTLAVAAPGDFVDGKLQPLADGFPNRPITLINVDDPGSRDGIYARTLQDALSKISPVDILVSDEPSPSFGTFYTLRDVAGRDGGVDGYYPIIVSVPGMMSDLLTESITKEIGMTADDANLVITTESAPYLMIQKKNAPWGPTFDGMVKYGKEHPGELKYISNQVGSGLDIAAEWVIAQAGIKVTKIPAPSNAAVGSTIGAGEGDFGLVLTPTALQHFQAGRADVTLATGSGVPAPWDKDPNATTTKAYGFPDVPWGPVIGFSVLKDTPRSHVDWLYKLLKAGADTDLYRQRLTTVPGTQIDIRDPDQANALKGQVLQFMGPIVESLGLNADAN